jgi:uncharacterized integral membrane protein
VLTLKLGRCVQLRRLPFLNTNNKAKEMNGFGVVFSTPVEIVAVGSVVTGILNREVIRHGA